MKIKVQYSFVSAIMGQEGTGETIMDLPDTGFVEQFRAFGNHMRSLAIENNYADLYDTNIEELC